MKFSAEVSPGEIVAIFDGNVHRVVGPGQNSPIHENGAPIATEIPGKKNAMYLIEVSNHTETSAIIDFLMIDDGLMVDFSNGRLQRGKETTFDELTVLHSV